MNILCFVEIFQKESKIDISSLYSICSLDVTLLFKLFCCVYIFLFKFKVLFKFKILFNFDDLKKENKTLLPKHFVHILHTHTHTHIYIYIYTIEFNKLATIIEGDPKAPFSIATTPRCRGRRYIFPGLLHFTLDPYLIILSVMQRGIKYHFLSLWCDSTWDWTQVSRAIGEHSNR